MHQSTRTVMTGRTSHYWVRLPLFVGLDAQSYLVPYLFKRGREQRTRLVPPPVSFRTAWIKGAAGTFFTSPFTGFYSQQTQTVEAFAEHFHQHLCRVKEKVVDLLSGDNPP